MKIISNFKDYYDHIVGKYGIDPKAVYQRVFQSWSLKGWVKSGIEKPHLISYPKEYDYNVLAICGTLYCITYTNGIFYFGDEIKDIKVRDYSGFGDTVSDNKRDAKFYHLRKTELNEQQNCPVLWAEIDYLNKIGAKFKNPKLSDFGIQKLIPPEDMWLNINNFLLREKIIVDNRTDKEKITSAGFDTKTSFRNIK